MINSYDSGLGLAALIMAALGFKFMFRYAKFWGRERVLNSPYLNGADEQRATRNYHLAKELLRRNEFNGALRYLQEAEQNLAASGIQNLPLSAGIFAQQALCYLRGNIGASSERQALSLVERACDIAALSGRDKVKLDALFARASVRNALGMTNDSEDDLRSCIELARKIYGKNSEREGRLLNNLALIMFQHGQLQDALDCYRLALPILESHTGHDSHLTQQARDGQVEVLKRLNGYS
ncbi:MAG: tetratricopeptide repeat protein [Candidatus Obscuribacter sp.]|nr:tetratricopeptide repeat protein [Candidatus Melainabacteria bacterium]MDX1986071.1 tetratricopeptide repeat protein [Candidatus Obscuribacter sp.]